MVTKPEVKAGINPAMSQLKLASKNKIEEIVNTKLCQECPECHCPTVFSSA
jgi:hypothetical protein